MIVARKTYTSCSELPLYNFIKIVVHDDLNFLYSERRTVFNRNIDLQPLWADIFAEYSTISNNTQSKHVFALTKEITVINHKLDIIQRAVNHLAKPGNYDVRLCDMLRRMGFMYKYNPDSLMNDLKLTISSAKRLVIRKQEAEDDYAKLNVSDKKVTEDDFYGLVRQLSRFNGFPIDVKKTTVTEFVKDINAFNVENAPKNNG